MRKGGKDFGGFHLYAKRHGEPREEVGAAMEEDSRGKGVCMIDVFFRSSN